MNFVIINGNIKVLNVCEWTRWIGSFLKPFYGFIVIDFHYFNVNSDMVLR